MRAISLWQPWASAMALGLKTIETRHWSTDYRGPLVIHAAKRWTRDEREWAELFADAFSRPELSDPPRGALLCTVELFDCRATCGSPPYNRSEEVLGNYADGRFAWRTRNLVRLPEPIPFLGAQGFFNVPDQLLGIAPVPAPQGDLL